MNCKRIYAIFIRQYYLIKSNPIRLVSMFLWTIIDILMWGFISKYLTTFGQATFSIVTVLLGAIILWEMMSRIQQGIMTSFLEDTWTQNLINFFASPLKIKEYLSGLVLISLAQSTVGFVIMLILTGLIFGYNIFIMGIFILPFILILIVFAISVGIFVTGMILRFGTTAEWVAWPIPFLLSIVSGVYYPVSTLPSFLQLFSKIIPSSYVFESMRNLLAGGAFSSDLAWNLSIGFVLAIAYLLIAYSFFIRVYKYNLNSGGIAKFNAEN